MIKYNKDVLWLKPFVEAAKSLIPFRKITNVKGYQVQAGLKELAEGSTLQDDKGRYSINLLTFSYNRDKREHRRKPMYSTLDTLAHELAHTVHWEHTDKHYELQARIMLRFAKVIKKMGIIDTTNGRRKVK